MEITDTEETVMVAWPVCVNPNRSKRIMGRESEDIFRFLISAEVSGRRTRMRKGRRKRNFVISIRRRRNREARKAVVVVLRRKCVDFEECVGKRRDVPVE